MENDKEIELIFPLAGLNVATEYGRQPKQTTPVGVNVRAYEVLAKRGRGGQRPGLTKYIPQQLPTGVHVIQHLNVLVDPEEPGLLLDGTFPITGYQLDTSTNNNALGYGNRNPGRYIRTGGSGKPQDRKPKKQINSGTYNFHVNGIVGGDGQFVMDARFGPSGNGPFNNQPYTIFCVPVAPVTPGPLAPGQQLWVVADPEYTILQGQSGTDRQAILIPHGDGSVSNYFDATVT